MSDQTWDNGPAIVQTVPLTRRQVLIALSLAQGKRKVKADDAQVWTRVTIEHIDDGALD